MKPDSTTHQNYDDDMPGTEPSDDEEVPPACREVKVESDDRIPEEAGYGYGV